MNFRMDGEAMAKFRASSLGPIARLQKASQQIVRPAAPTAAPQGRFASIFPPAPPRWEHTNPRSEITVKPRRNGVLWSR
jgi:hypothetical protein